MEGGVAVDGEYLIARREDQLVLGVRFTGMELVGQAPPSLRAVGPASSLILTFPPQHVAEQVIGENPAESFQLFDHLGCRLAGTSRVAFAVPAGTTIPLTAHGILAAVDAGAILPGRPADPAIPGDTAGPTAIEIPWGLVLAPEPRSGQGVVTAFHAAAPLALETGSFGVWWTSLRASGTRRPDADAGLALRPIDRGKADQPDPAFPIPLQKFARNLIVNAGVRAPAPAERLDLSPLGGSLSVQADWPNLRWAHDATLGRDRRVHVAAGGVLYPLGHRAELIELTERVCVETTTPPIMALQRHRTLTIIETARRFAPADATLARSFPFTEVEIMESSVSIADSPVTHIEQPAPETAELSRLRQETQARLDAAILDALAVVVGPGTSPIDLAPATVEEILDERFETTFGPRPDTPPEVLTYFGIRDILAFIDSLLEGAPLESVPLFFMPTDRDGTVHRFPVRLAGASGDVQIALPLLFVFDQRLSDPLGVVADLVTLTDPRAHDMLDREYARTRAGQVETHGVAMDFVGSAAPAPSDVQQVHRLNVVGSGRDGGFVPRLGAPPGVQATAEAWAFEAAMPAVRSLLGAAAPNTPLRFSDNYLRDGTAADVLFRTVAPDPIRLDFVGRANLSGGLIAPQLAADAVSRAHGLVQSAALGAPALDPAKVLGDASTLLGFKLSDLVDPSKLRVPPGVTARLDGATPEVRMEWKDIELRDAPPFVARGAKLDLSVVTGRAESSTTCTVTNFTLALPRDPTLLEVAFDSLRFTQLVGRPPKLEVGRAKVTFKGLLRLLEELQNHIGLADAAPRVRVDDTRIVAQYLLPIPSAPCGVFILRNIAFGALVDVPFNGEPVSVTLAFASRAKPFNLSVLAFGGGGYLELEVNHRGLQRLEASLEFGASVAVDFIVASGEVHALGGVRFVLEGGQVPQLTGFLRLGGSIEVLGLISVSVELLLTLFYDRDTNELYGRAKLIVEIDLLLYSDSVELDSGKWVLAGGSAPVEEVVSDRLTATRPALFGARLFAAQPTEAPVETWRRYRRCFA